MHPPSVQSQAIVHGSDRNNDSNRTAVPSTAICCLVLFNASQAKGQKLSEMNEMIHLALPYMFVHKHHKPCQPHQCSKNIFQVHMGYGTEVSYPDPDCLGPDSRAQSS